MLGNKIISICGIDEAGKGALAGPLVCAAVVIPKGWSLEILKPKVSVKDSKKLSVKQREILFKLIKRHALKVDLEIISIDKINQKGIRWANHEGFRRLILRTEASEYICDGILRLKRLGQKTKITHSAIDADENIPAALCAGIVAKIEWDKIMKNLHLKHPNYGWLTNTGHGTKQHIEAIIMHGQTVYHRHQFVKTALANWRLKQE